MGKSTVTGRIEKHKGITLVVEGEWSTVVHDATGFEVSGPVTNDDEVKHMVRVAIATFKQLVQEGTDGNA